MQYLTSRDVLGTYVLYVTCTMVDPLSDQFILVF